MTGIAKRLPQLVTSTFGVLNLVFVVVGLYVSFQTLAHPGHLSNSQFSPFLVEVFYTMSAVNLLFLLVLALSGFLLLRTGIKAVKFANVVFLAEIVYLVGSLWPTRGPVGHSITGAYGIGNVAIMVQLVVGYPVVALIALNVARYRFKKRDNRVPDG